MFLHCDNVARDALSSSTIKTPTKTGSNSEPIATPSIVDCLGC